MSADLDREAMNQGPQEIKPLTVTTKDGATTVDEFYQRIACTPILLGTADLTHIRTEVLFSFDNRHASYVVVGWEADALVMEKTAEWVFCEECRGRIHPQRDRGSREEMASP